MIHNPKVGPARDQACVRGRWRRSRGGEAVEAVVVVVLGGENVRRGDRKRSLGGYGNID